MRTLDGQSTAGCEPYRALSELLRRRAVEKGAVLLLTDDPARSPIGTRRPSAGAIDCFLLPPFEYTRAPTRYAAALLAGGRFEAVGVALAATDPNAAAPILETLARS